MRIAGITIPDNKKLKVGLTAVYGIGRSRAEKILQKAGIEPGSKPANLSAENENKIRDIVQEFKIEGDRDPNEVLKELAYAGFPFRKIEKNLEEGASCFELRDQAEIVQGDYTYIITQLQV